MQAKKIAGDQRRGLPGTQRDIGHAQNFSTQNTPREGLFRRRVAATGCGDG